MTRAFLIVMDSVGIGGAPDAGEFFNGAVPDTGANTRRPTSPTRWTCACPTLDALGLGAACRLASGVAAARADRTAHRRLGRGDRGLARQGHALGPLGAGRRAGALGLGLLPRHRPRLPRRRGGRGLPPRRDRRHPRQPPRLGHRHHRRGGRGAPADRLAHLLHLGRQRVPDRRARGGVRPRPPDRALPRPRADAPRPTDRAGSSRGPSSASPGTFKRTAAPPRLRHRAARADAARPRATRPGGRVHAVGKIGDIFSMRGIDTLAKGPRRGPDGSPSTGSPREAEDGLADLRQLRRVRHRVRPPPRPRRLRPRTSNGSTASSRRLIPALREGDLLVVTADHGNDPTWTGTDHTRERVPVLVHGLGARRARPHGLRRRGAPRRRPSRGAPAMSERSGSTGPRSPRSSCTSTSRAPRRPPSSGASRARRRSTSPASSHEDGSLPHRRPSRTSCRAYEAACSVLTTPRGLPPPDPRRAGGERGERRRLLRDASSPPTSAAAATSAPGATTSPPSRTRRARREARMGITAARHRHLPAPLRPRRPRRRRPSAPPRRPGRS